ncbi:MAG: nucleotide sugar dehydrogenase, partial [Candidatus Accumulibacter sp.]|nr:nucleotide sugar dehydrogenase [Accumulibacter sp.]
NSHVIDVIRELESYGAQVLVHEPVADADEARHEYDVELMAWEQLPPAAAIVAAVAHRQFKQRPLADYLGKLQKGGVLADVKSIFNAAEVASHGVTLWRL